MATVHEVRGYLGTLSTTLWNYGASFPVPTLDDYGLDEVGFAFVAEMPGSATPKPAEVRLAEVWARSAVDRLELVAYQYDFIEYPMARRRAFHGHDQDWFRREFGVLVHEHCEEVLGSPACDHYFGFPVNGLDAIRAFTATWGQARLGCSELRCMQ